MARAKGNGGAAADDGVSKMELVRQAIEDARRDGVAIIPLCPFAKAQIDRRPEWQDVLRKS